MVINQRKTIGFTEGFLLSAGLPDSARFRADFYKFLNGLVLRFGPLRLVTGQDRCQNAWILHFFRPENNPG